MCCVSVCVCVSVWRKREVCLYYSHLTGEATVIGVQEQHNVNKIPLHLLNGVEKYVSVLKPLS